MTKGGPASQVVVRPEWLAARQEVALEPAQPIIDAHHHLYDRPYLTYLLPDYLADLACGHNVRASVFVQARAMLTADASREWEAVGETEFVNGVAAMSASGLYGDTRICAGIVGFADLTLGDRVTPVLERHVQAGGGRFRGIRQTLCWDEDRSLLNPAYPTFPGMAQAPEFRAGFARLAALGLSFDAWSFFPQADDIVTLARAFPDVPIVIDHCGGIVRIRGYEAQPDVYTRWRDGITRLAGCPNVVVKLSGLGMRLGGFGFEDGALPPGSVDLAAAWRPWVMQCIDSFGAGRCMWGSNFPVDKSSYAFGIGLNAMKHLMAEASDDERHAVFHGTASRIYRLSGPSIPATVHRVPTMLEAIRR